MLGLAYCADSAGDTLPSPPTSFDVPKGLGETLPKLQTDAWLEKTKNKISSINYTQCLQVFPTPLSFDKLPRTEGPPVPVKVRGRGSLALMGLSTPCHLFMSGLNDGPKASFKGRFNLGKSSKQL